MAAEAYTITHECQTKTMAPLDLTELLITKLSYNMSAVFSLFLTRCVTYKYLCCKKMMGFKKFLNTTV